MLFTLFTPTFNRRHTLLRLFESLEAQTFRDFEWLVVDDGSTDGTGEFLRELESRASFPLRYHYQPNGGKHVASNRAVDLAAGQLLPRLIPTMLCSPTPCDAWPITGGRFPRIGAMSSPV